MTVRTRFAPSPTGYLHIGGARTALYCWLQSRRNGGQFVLRIEDTDRERSTQAAIDAILEAMEWLGLDYDEGPIFQTHRLDRYKEMAEELVASGHAYYAYESKAELEAMREAAMAAGNKPRYNGAYRTHNAEWRDDPNRVIRFRNPDEGVVAWVDKVKGRIEIANSELDDLVIFRPDGYATYNFAVVVDDIDMAISDVVRGDDHVNNTPRQINIYRALGAAVPAFSHLPMILDEQGAKLSKRTGAADVMQYRDAGYLPHALLNYLVRLGWSHGDQEVFSITEMQSLFDLSTCTPRPARLDMAKLGWLNQQYLKNDDPVAVGKSPAMASAAGGLRPCQWACACRHRHRIARSRADAEGDGRTCLGVVWPAHAATTTRRSPSICSAAARAPLADMRTRLARAGGVDGRGHRCCIPRHGRGLRVLAWARSRSRCGWRSPAPRSARISRTRFTWPASSKPLARIDAALAKIPTGD